MNALWRFLQPLVSFVGGVRRLGLRAIVLTIAAMAVLNISILTVLSLTSRNFDQRLIAPPIMRQAAAAAALMDGLGPDERRVALAALNSPVLRFSLTPDFSETPPVQNPAPVFVPVLAAYAAVLGDRAFSVYLRVEKGFWFWRSAALTDDLIIVMRLADGSGLVVETGATFRRAVALYAIALIVALAGVVLIGLMIWASLSYARPLGRLADASQHFVEQVKVNPELDPLPETGPKPVRELANALNLMNAQLVRMMAERTTTLAAIAHDLRTYLTRFRMRSEFIEDDAQREDAVRDCEDMAQLVENALMLGRSAVKPLAPERLELVAWLGDFVERRAALGEPVTLSAAIGVAVVSVAAPELKRVLNNLVDNALRYAGSATLSLTEAGADLMVIEVRDDGPGVPEAFLAQISEPFTRVEGSRSRDTGGAGLGLAIARTLVERSGGALTFSNRAAGGFCARVQLRRADGPPKG